jgi:hypothetical protein
MKSGENVGVYFLDGLCNNLYLITNQQCGGRTTRFNP